MRPTQPGGGKDRRIDRRLGVGHAAQHVQQFAEARTGDALQLCPLHLPRRRQTLAQPALHRVPTVAQHRDERLHDPQGVGPVEALTAVQVRRSDERSVGLRLEALALGKAIRKDGEVVLVLGHRPALVRRRRRTGEANADAPVIAGRDQNEREQPAGKRLGLVAVTLVDAAPALFAEEHTTAVGPVVERVAPVPEPAAAHERRVAAEVHDGVPFLRLDASPFLFGERDQVFLAATTGDVTVPVLHHRQRSDREGHEGFLGKGCHFAAKGRSIATSSASGVSSVFGGHWRPFIPQPCASRPPRTDTPSPDGHRYRSGACAGGPRPEL